MEVGEFFLVTFVPAGLKRPVTWMLQFKNRRTREGHPDLLSWVRVNKQGEERQAGTMELVLTRADEIKIKPLVMDAHYGELVPTNQESEQSKEIRKRFK